jgi:hypothetical protein
MEFSLVSLVFKSEIKFPSNCSILKSSFTSGLSQLGRPRHKLVDNIRVDLRYDGAVWNGLI